MVLAGADFDSEAEGVEATAGAAGIAFGAGGPSGSTGLAGTVLAVFGEPPDFFSLEEGAAGEGALVATAGVGTGSFVSCSGWRTTGAAGGGGSLRIAVALAGSIGGRGAAGFDGAVETPTGGEPAAAAPAGQAPAIGAEPPPAYVERDAGGTFSSRENRFASLPKRPGRFGSAAGGGKGVAVRFEAIGGATTVAGGVAGTLAGRDAAGIIGCGTGRGRAFTGTPAIGRNVRRLSSPLETVIGRVDVIGGAAALPWSTTTFASDGTGFDSIAGEAIGLEIGSAATIGMVAGSGVWTGFAGVGADSVAFSGA